MGPAGDGGEGRRQGQDFHALVQHGAEQLGKAQVITDGEPQPAERRIDHHHLAAGFYGLGFVVALVALRHLDIEQVHLVVTCDPLALVVIEQTGRAHLVRRIRGQRHRAADQPDAKLARLLGKEVLDLPFAVLFPDGDLVGLLEAHEGEVLRQHHQPGAGPGRLGEQAFGLHEVAADIGAGGHLDGGHQRHGSMPSPSDTPKAAVPLPPGTSSMCLEATPRATSQLRSSAARRLPSSPPG